MSACVDILSERTRGYPLTTPDKREPENPGNQLLPSGTAPSKGLGRIEWAKATHYVLKVDIGGIPGVVAPLVGKQPPDSHVWILEGEAPAFVRSQAPMFIGGPVWQTDLVSPVWSRGR